MPAQGWRPGEPTIRNNMLCHRYSASVVCECKHIMTDGISTPESTISFRRRWCECHSSCNFRLYLTGWGYGSKNKLSQVGLMLHDQAQCYDDYSVVFREDTMLCIIDPDMEKSLCHVCHLCLWVIKGGRKTIFTRITHSSGYLAPSQHQTAYSSQPWLAL